MAINYLQLLQTSHLEHCLFSDMGDTIYWVWVNKCEITFEKIP